jgi:hypothetical protein
MFDCKKCGHCFRDSYNLSKHMLRKKSCTPINNESLNNVNKQYSGNTTSVSGNTTNLKVHMNNCKSREDPVRLLEIERDIKTGSPPSKTECRFCNNDYHRIDSLHRHIKVCKKREEYHQALLKQGERCTIIINNNNIYNGTVNNGTLNNFGETLECISDNDFLIILEKYYKSISENNQQLQFLVGNFLIDFEKMIK